jgi:sugar phosphate isomerase/epimerase
MSHPLTPHESASPLDRRDFLKSSALAAGALVAGQAFVGASRAQAQSVAAAGAGKAPTKFIHACMTLTYSQFPLMRALTGIKGAGYDHVAWGTQHRESDGVVRDVMPLDAPPERAGELGRICRDVGLEPVKMFSRLAPDAPDAIPGLTNRIRQAAAAGIGQLLIFGQTRGGDPKTWVERLTELGPVAADHNVLLVVKQHGGETTGTGRALARIVRAVDHPNVWLSYDAGNVAWYLDVDPLEDIPSCADLIRGFCLKDARSWPLKSTPGPGHGEIDHYRLFAPVAFTGLTMTLAYERVDPSILRPRVNPTDPAVIDGWARWTREYIEDVLTGLQGALASA